MVQLEESKINPFPRFIIILSIPAMLFAFLILGYLSIIPLKVELHSLIIIFLILLIFLFFIPHNALYTYAKYKNSLEQILDDIDAYLLRNELIIQGRKKSYGSIDSFFDNHLKNIRNDNFANVAASIFPTLGILGTFTAIAISMPNFTVDSKEALENEITILLSGVGTAFYASIYGIFLSLWWIFFEKRGLTKIQNDIEKQKVQYKDSIWLKEEIELLKLSDTNASTKLLIDKIESIVTPEFIYKLDNVAQAKLEVIAKLNEEERVSEQRLVENYSRLTQLFEDANNKQENLISSYEELKEQISKTNTSLQDSIDANTQNQKAIKSEIYSVLSSFELVSSDIKTLGKSLIEKS